MYSGTSNFDFSKKLINFSTVNVRKSHKNTFFMPIVDIVIPVFLHNQLTLSGLIIFEVLSVLFISNLHLIVGTEKSRHKFHTSFHV